MHREDAADNEGTVAAPSRLMAHGGDRRHSILGLLRREDLLDAGGERRCLYDNAERAVRAAACLAGRNVRADVQRAAACSADAAALQCGSWFRRLRRSMTATLPPRGRPLRDALRAALDLGGNGRERMPDGAFPGPGDAIRPPGAD